MHKSLAPLAWPPAALVAAAALLCAVGCGSKEPARSSIVLLTLDTLRADRLGCYGYGRPTSPVLDALAREGVVFERVITPSSFTLPAHVSLMTSTNPTRHGIKGNFARLGVYLSEEQGLYTLAQVLAESDYDTAAFVSATPVKEHTGIDLGFLTFDQPEGRERRAAETTDRVLAWLDEPRERPFFLWVHYFDPHGPYEPPAPHDTMFTTDEILQSFLETRQFPRRREERVLSSNNLYDGEIRYLDDQIGRLFEELRRRRMWDSSVIAVTADHGEGLGQHGWMHHGTIHNEQLFVPLILKLSRNERVPRGSRFGELASLIDVAPTLLAALGMPLPVPIAAQFEGIDLFGPSDEREHLYSEEYRQRPLVPLRHSLTGRRWKYVHSAEDDDQLFDMVADPFELHDVIDEHPEIAERWEQAILRILEDEVRQAPLPSSVPRKRLEELRQLGYLK